jgi:hypothetical protein
VFIRINEWQKKIPTSPGWLSFFELNEVVAGTRVLAPEFLDMSLIQTYINEFALRRDTVAALGGSYAVFSEADRFWTVQGLESAAAFTVFDASLTPAFVAARDALLAKLQVEMTVHPLKEVASMDGLTAPDLVALIA